MKPWMNFKQREEFKYKEAPLFTSSDLGLKQAMQLNKSFIFPEAAGVLALRDSEPVDGSKLRCLQQRIEYIRSKIKNTLSDTCPEVSTHFQLHKVIAHTTYVIC